MIAVDLLHIVRCKVTCRAEELSVLHLADIANACLCLWAAWGDSGAHVAEHDASPGYCAMPHTYHAGLA